MPYLLTLDSALLSSNSDDMRQALAQLMHYVTFHFDTRWSMWHDGNFGLMAWHPMVPSPVPYPELDLTNAMPSIGTIITTPERANIFQNKNLSVLIVHPSPQAIGQLQQTISQKLESELSPYQRLIAPSQRFYPLMFPSGWEELFHERTNIAPSENADCDRFGPFGWLRRLEYSWSLAQVNYAKGSTIIDIGSLETFIPQYLAERDLDVTSIDIDPVGVEFQKNIAEKLPKPFRVELQDITRTTYASESFDQALMISTVEHIPGDGDCRAMREIHRLLKKGGIVALTTPYDHQWAHEDTGIRPYKYLQRYYSMNSALTRLAPQDLFDVVDIEFIGGTLHSPGNYTPQFINPTNAAIIALALRKK